MARTKENQRYTSISIVCQFLSIFHLQLLKYSHFTNLANLKEFFL